ncbi:MAG: Flp pilus assembly protein CpaB [Verrucomicrobia bacterium]|nr:Flp pilus assembly protein CpaB [Verrucomicrobiota bacterium]
MKTTIRPGTLFIGGSLLLGAITFYLLYNYLQEVSKPKAAVKTAVVMARVDIPARQAISEPMVALFPVPPELVVPTAATNVAQVVGKFTTGPVKQFEQIRLKDIAEKDKVPGLSPVIPTGKRAITIAINDTKGVAGAIFPGDSVDILCSLKDPTRGEQVTHVPLQNMKVLAIDRAITSATQGATSSLTLCASPEEAQLITVAEEQGVIRVILRAQGDEVVAEDKTVTLDRFLKRSPKIVEEKEEKSKAEPAPVAATAPAPPPKRKIIIYDGGKTIEHEVRYP